MRRIQQAIVAAVQEASLRAPSILFLPHAEQWWTNAPPSQTAALVAALHALGPHERVALLSTVEDVDVLVGELGGTCARPRTPQRVRSRATAPRLRLTPQSPFVPPTRGGAA